MLKGFKDFIMRGNVVELAIAVVIGTAFQAVVSGVVAAIIQPLVNAAGGSNVNGLGFSIKHTPGAAHGSAQDVLGKSTFINLSAVINAIIAFIVTAAVVYFLIVLPMNKIQERRAAKTAKGEPDPTPKSEDIILLEQIRDLLSAADRHQPADAEPAADQLSDGRGHRSLVVRWPLPAVPLVVTLARLVAPAGGQLVLRHVGQDGVLAVAAWTGPRAAIGRAVGHGKFTHSSEPSVNTWRFQIGSRAFASSTSRPHRANASARCAVATAATSATSPTVSSPTRWLTATASTSGSSAISPGDPVQHLLRAGMALVLELDDAATVVVLPDDAAEHDPGAGPDVLDRGLVQGDVERRGRDRDVPHDRVDLAAGRRLSVVRRAHTPPPGRWSPPPSWSTACPSSGASTAMPSRTPPGEPGSVTTSADPMVPATPRDSTDVGTFSRETARSASAMPGTARSSIGSTASGVTSVGVRPVPPVVSTAVAPAARASRTAARMCTTSSGTMRRSTTS